MHRNGGRKVCFYRSGRASSRRYGVGGRLFWGLTTIEFVYSPDGFWFAIRTRTNGLFFVDYLHKYRKCILLFLDVFPDHLF